MPSIYESHPRFQKSELDRRLTGLNGLSSWDRHVSASRKQMHSSHIGQTLVVDGASESWHNTGMEDEFGEHTFHIKMPCDANILKVIYRYQKTQDINSIAFSPEMLVIYENTHDKKVGCLSIPQFYSHHQHFGFRYQPTEAFKQLKEGRSIAKDTILVDSPNVTKDGRYFFGVNMDVAYMSHPATSEDGIVIARSALKKFTFRKYETRVLEWGTKQILLNTHGTDTIFKGFLEVGEIVPGHGMIAAFRNKDENFSPVEQSRAAMRVVDKVYDNIIYAPPGGRVIDIQVMHDPESQTPSTLTGTDEQPMKYDTQRRDFYNQIHNFYLGLLHRRGASLEITPEFQQLLVTTISVVQPNKKPEKGQPRERVAKLYRTAPLDDWRVKVIIEYTVTPTTGFKLTDQVGG